MLVGLLGQGGSYCLGIEAARFWRRGIAARELNKNYKSLIVPPPPPPQKVTDGREGSFAILGLRAVRNRERCSLLSRSPSLLSQTPKSQGKIRRARQPANPECSGRAAPHCLGQEPQVTHSRNTHKYQTGDQRRSYSLAGNDVVDSIHSFRLLLIGNSIIISPIPANST